MFDDYLKEVSDLLENKNSKKAIIAELESHLYQEADYYIELGFSEKEAYEKTIENIGNPTIMAEQLNKIHKISWYDHPISFMSLFLHSFLILTILAAFPSFVYTNSSITHSILFDFSALAIFTVHFIFFYYSRKLKSTFIALNTCFFIIFEQIVTFIFDEPLSLYQPLFYSIITVFSKGFIEYRNSIFFHNSNIMKSEGMLIKLASYILSTLLIFLVILTIVYIIRQKALETTKNIKFIFNFLEKLFYLIICVDFIIMASSTISASCNLIKNHCETYEKKTEIMNYVINANLSVPINEQREKLIYSGYNTRYYKYNTKDRLSYCEINMYNYYGNILSLASYSPYKKPKTPLSDKTYSISYKNTHAMFFKSFNKIQKEKIENLEKDITIDDFLQYQFFSDPIEIYHYRTRSDTPSEIVSFKYNINNKETCDIMFENGVLYYITY